MKAAAVLLSLLVCAGGAAVTLVGDAQTGPSREPTSHVFTIDSASPSQMHELKSFEEDSTGVYRSGCLDAAAGVAYLSFAVEDEDGEVTFRIDALDVETGRITKGAHFTMRLYYNMACDSVWHAVVLADVRDEHTAMFYRVDPAAGTVTHLLNYTLADPILQIFNRDAAYDSDTHTMYLLNNNYVHEGRILVAPDLSPAGELPDAQVQRQDDRCQPCQQDRGHLPVECDPGV
eukprot:TRINITY_DN2809_c0_g1_i2.p1 TRINITY_DN2809_c0_g1~~TRINITY_DN2809_c0_g1_i2.p1  ORF type:complete len:232 (-),score=62.01 TRINITY_DN2809_c0_g1_i2:36-731(-)